jgi:hypothetical protein
VISGATLTFWTTERFQKEDVWDMLDESRVTVARAVQYCLLKFVERRDLRPPRAAA